MKTEQRTAVHDSGLRLEAYRLQGITQPFPNHFHEYYVLGLIETGERILSCGGRTSLISEGSILLFAPGDNHGCTQHGGTLDYRGLNISPEIFLELSEAVPSQQALHRFSRNVIWDTDIACHFRSVHDRIMNREANAEKASEMRHLISLLLQRYGQTAVGGAPAYRAEIEKVCAYIEAHYAERIKLDELYRCAGLSKSTLLRAFTRAKGVTPYSYLENLRIGQAKKLLERGTPPAEAALQTGFSDQSHLTNSFSRYIGIAPGAYRGIF